jgi:hypothetical protein
MMQVTLLRKDSGMDRRVFMRLMCVSVIAPRVIGKSSNVPLPSPTSETRERNRFKRMHHGGLYGINSSTMKLSVLLEPHTRYCPGSYKLKFMDYAKIEKMIIEKE